MYSNYINCLIKVSLELIRLSIYFFLIVKLNSIWMFGDFHASFSVGCCSSSNPTIIRLVYNSFLIVVVSVELFLHVVSIRFLLNDYSKRNIYRKVGPLFSTYWLLSCNEGQPMGEISWKRHFVNINERLQPIFVVCEPVISVELFLSVKLFP